MIVNEPGQHKKKITLVANSAWSVYNFRMDLIRHLLLSFDVLIVAPRDEFAVELIKAGCAYHAANTFLSRLRTQCCSHFLS